MNTFGQYFKVSIFGESHGPAIGVVLDGVPENIPLSEADFEADIARRAPGIILARLVFAIRRNAIVLN